MPSKEMTLGHPSLGIKKPIKFYCFLSLFHVSIWQKGWQNCQESSAEVIGMTKLKDKVCESKAV